MQFDVIYTRPVQNYWFEIHTLSSVHLQLEQREFFSFGVKHEFCATCSAATLQFTLEHCKFKTSVLKKVKNYLKLTELSREYGGPNFHFQASAQSVNRILAGLELRNILILKFSALKNHFLRNNTKPYVLQNIK